MVPGPKGKGQKPGADWVSAVISRMMKNSGFLEKEREKNVNPAADKAAENENSIIKSNNCGIPHKMKMYASI